MTSTSHLNSPFHPLTSPRLSPRPQPIPPCPIPTFSEHPDTARCPGTHSDSMPTRTSDTPGLRSVSVFSPPSPLLTIETSPPVHPLRSPSQEDNQCDTLSNLSGSSTAFDDTCPDGAAASLTDKGKAKEPPPTLPPLSLSPSGLGYNIDDWSSTAGPSSYRSTCPSLRTASSSHSPSSLIESNVVQVDDPPALTKVPSRTRSLSNLSVHSTTPSMTKIRIKLAASSKAPVNLARRLLSRNKADAAGPAVSGLADDLADTLQNDLMTAEAGNCHFPWQTKDITRTSSPRPGVEHDRPVAALDIAATWYPDNHRLDGPAVDLDDIIVPVPLHARNLFDEMLPRELRLRVFSALISLHEADCERLKSGSKWTVLVASASKNRWTGRNRAMRELVKLSRVGIITYCSVIHFGKPLISGRSQPQSADFLASLVQLSGPFIKNLDLSGHTYLSPTTLIDMAGGLCVRSAPIVNFTYTQLTAINLQGCTALTTQSLHSLLVRSPFLRSLNVKGLQAVTNATFDVLALCSHLTSLNMNRCTNIDGDGVCAFGAAVIARGARLALKELRLCGLHMIDDDTLATLGKAAPHLEILDLSYCHSLHNSALEAFVACTDDGTYFGETISLTSRDAGRDPRDSRRYRRHVTALRHLSLSNCIMLTDTACSNLAHCVPRLEFLELAGIGETLKDDGLVHLLNTTPFIRKLDLEDASDITDAVLEVLTPEPAIERNGSTPSKETAPPKPGHALEHLTVSCATNLTNDAFKALIRGCPKLRVLEADSTSMSGPVVKDFVRQVCERGINDAGLVVVDCRSVGERAIKDVVANTRPRKGCRSWEARKLGYLDGRDGEDLKVGQDECDEKRVVIKSFIAGRPWTQYDTSGNGSERQTGKRKMG
ncbi:hypothetical protein JVU11DRAFT_4748 [Chiua virens]|nr:hypothetical protein JVU11DRAFT_4748 [Chiua virens]